MAFSPETIAKTEEKFNSFSIHNTTYQHVDGQPITTDILIPKPIKPGTHPVIVRFHGGFLITSTSLEPTFFAPWILDFAIAHSAILISPNYVKLPESTGLDILANLAHFWDWLRGDELQAMVRSIAGPEVVINLSQTLVIGHSAGGYLAIQSGLSQPQGSIKAIVAAYPMIDMMAPLGTRPFGLPSLPSSVIYDHLANMKLGQVVTGLPPPPTERLDLAVAAVQHHQFPRLLGIDKSLYPLERLKEASSFPPLFIYHGTEDSAVDIASTKKFVEDLRRIVGEDRLVVKLEPGEHGLDTTVDLEDLWMKEGLTFVVGKWLP